MEKKIIDVVIFDIDGCIADDRHRRPLLPKSPQSQMDFDEYHAHADLDECTMRGRALFSYWANTIKWRNGEVAFLTARPESMRNNTEKWLRTHMPIGACPQFILIMRPDGNMLHSPALKLSQLSWLDDHIAARHGQYAHANIVHAFDDRIDVLQMYFGRGIECSLLDIGLPAVYPYTGDNTAVCVGPDIANDADKPARGAEEFGQGVEAILGEALETYRARNAAYLYNAEKVGKVMEAMFPDGVTLKGAGDFHMFHLFELMMVKATRFANSGLKHTDSMRDCGVYSFMCENLVEDHAITIHKPNKEDPK